MSPTQYTYDIAPGKLNELIRATHSERLEEELRRMRRTGMLLAASVLLLSLVVFLLLPLGTLRS